MNQKKVVRPIKKIAQDVDNSSNYSEKRYKMICQIQQLLKKVIVTEKLPAVWEWEGIQ